MEPFQGFHDLICTIPGINTITADVIVAQIGADISRFPTAKHLASWAGTTPPSARSIWPLTSDARSSVRACPVVPHAEPQPDGGTGGTTPRSASITVPLRHSDRPERPSAMETYLARWSSGPVARAGRHPRIDPPCLVLG
jgi:hypothetical protein